MNTRRIILTGLLSAVLILLQVALSFLPNIEVVTTLIIIYTLVFDKKVFYIIYTFALLEGIIYGFGIWWINYLYIWTILAIITMVFRKNSSVILWAVISGFYGLIFGLLCSIPYFFIGGIGAGAAYWVSGIPMDIVHCAGNAVLTFILFQPVYRILVKLNKNIFPVHPGSHT